MKKIIILLIQLAILLTSHFVVWGDTIIIVGITAIILQAAFSLQFAGWVSAASYPVTYWIAALCDTPQNGNLYVYWYFGYIGVVLSALVIDYILKQRNKKTSLSL